MSELDGLIEACRAAPDDDAPRLVWADAVGGERGEFVVLQCRLARDDLSPAEQGALIRRHDELLAAHGREWSGFGDEGGARRYMFRRGFVESVQLNLYKVPWATLFQRMPLVRSVHLCGAQRIIEHHKGGEPDGPEPIPFLAQLFEAPEMQRLDGFEIESMYLRVSDGENDWDNHHVTRYGDEALELVRSSGKLSGFRTFAIREEFTPRGFQALLDSNLLASVENLALDWGKVDPSQAAELFTRTPNLRALEVRGTLRLKDVAHLIPTSIVELQLTSFSDIDALCASPMAASLERLRLSNSMVKRMRFDAFPRLRVLDLAQTYAQDDQQRLTEALASTSLPALRELRPFFDLSNARTLALVEAFGSQLACLDLLNLRQITSVDEIRAKVVGHVRAGPYQNDVSPMVVGIDTREPWLRYGLVEGES